MHNSQLTTHLNILFEDNHILIVEKPSNLLVQSDVSGDEDLLTKLRDYLREKYNKPGNIYLGLVHRLDRNVGGVMVFAKTSKAASRLSEQIRNRTFKKEYLAVVQKTATASAIIQGEKETLENFILKDEEERKAEIVSEDFEDAKKAILDYEVLEVKDELALLKINLKTGRFHQIRVQLANIGWPIYGDKKYGFRGEIIEAISLWAYRVEFTHPISKEIVSFSSYPRREFPWNNFKSQA